jgi:hypothetical protein
MRVGSTQQQLKSAEDDLAKARWALRVVPVILSQLDNDGCDMLADLLQACIETGYEDGFKDCQRHFQQPEE